MLLKRQSLLQREGKRETGRERQRESPRDLATNAVTAFDKEAASPAHMKALERHVLLMIDTCS